ncbi:MAG TPA: NAD-dependent epimerase/dehydratase family protein [Myxococcota bacterium]|nr:NAD-dependent epimerase/dehydratase family protein [Myxococcota bacterium]HRY96137.1 NAD-dependent epimerase/dehydratase family protein [Myxococcota bacterium]
MSTSKSERAGGAGRVVAVTGISEFLGQRLIGLMESDPRFRKILALDVREPERLGPKSAFRHVDLTHPSAGQELAELFRAQGVDTAVHLAIMSNPSHDASYAHELHVAGTMHMLGAAAASQLAHFLVVGSTLTYGARPDNPAYLGEASPLRGTARCPFIDDLVESEKLVEDFARSHPRVVTCVLRMASALGPHIDTMLSRLLRSSLAPAVLGHDPLFQTVHELDALEALKLAVDEPRPGAYNIAAEGVLPLSSLTRVAGCLPLPLPPWLADRLLGMLWAAQAVTVPPSFLDYLRYPCVADASRARRALGFQPRYTTREALRNFVRLRGLEDNLADAEA